MSLKVYVYYLLIHVQWVQKFLNMQNHILMNYQK